MNPAEVSAVLVTRGNVALDEILDSISAAGITDTVVWDNSVEEDLSVYGRYAAIERAKHDLILCQDDDCVVPIARLLSVASYYDLDSQIVANMSAGRWDEYPDSCLIGWGAVFHRGLPTRAFGRFTATHGDAGWPTDWAYGPSVLRTCDVVFTTLTPHVKVDLGHENLPWATAPDRMWNTDPQAHNRERGLMLDLARKVRDS